MLQQKGRKSIIYLFLLILAGSINNTSFNNTNFDKIQTIKVTGLSSTENFIIINKIKKLKLKNIFFINSDQIKKIIDSNTLVEKYKVYKNYPSGLEINITKTKFLAKINSQGNIFIIGSNGKLSKDYDNKNKLPFIFGKPNIQEFLQFKKVIDHSKFRYEHIKNFYFFPSMRWDLEFKDNVILKLPKNNTKESLDHIFEFLNNKSLNDKKIIDARIQNQIILND